MTEVRAAVREDLRAVVELLGEIDRFYGATDLEPLDLRRDQVDQALFSGRPVAHSLLAWEAELLVGLASYSFVWPAAGMTSSLYLKELYVTKTHRGRGVGRLLMQHLAVTALDHGCSRIEWMTDQDNPAAREFYRGLGVNVNTEKLFYRLSGPEEIRRMTVSP